MYLLNHKTKGDRAILDIPRLPFPTFYRNQGFHLFHSCSTFALQTSNVWLQRWKKKNGISSSSTLHKKTLRAAKRISPKCYPYIGSIWPRLQPITKIWGLKAVHLTCPKPSKCFKQFNANSQCFIFDRSQNFYSFLLQNPVFRFYLVSENTYWNMSKTAFNNVITTFNNRAFVLIHGYS